MMSQDVANLSQLFCNQGNLYSICDESFGSRSIGAQNYDWLRWLMFTFFLFEISSLSIQNIYVFNSQHGIVKMANGDDGTLFITFFERLPMIYGSILKCFSDIPWQTYFCFRLIQNMNNDENLWFFKSSLSWLLNIFLMEKTKNKKRESGK